MDTKASVNNFKRKVSHVGSNSSCVDVYRSGITGKNFHRAPSHFRALAFLPSRQNSFATAIMT